MTTIQILLRNRVARPMVALVERTIARLNRSIDQLRWELALSAAGAKKLAEQNRRLTIERDNYERDWRRQVELNRWLIDRGFEFRCEGNYLGPRREINGRASISPTMAMEVMLHPDKQQLGFYARLDDDMAYNRRAELYSAYTRAIADTFRVHIEIALLRAIGRTAEADQMAERLDGWRKKRPA